MEKQLFSVILFFVCLHFFFRFFFFSFISELSPMMSKEQTNKKIQIVSASIARSPRGGFFCGGGMEWSVIVRTVGWTQKGGGGGGGGRRSIKFMKGGESSKFKKTEDGCAADGGCTPPATRRDGACAGVCGLNVLKRRQQQRKHNKIKKSSLGKKKMDSWGKTKTKKL